MRLVYTRTCICGICASSRLCRLFWCHIYIYIRTPVYILNITKGYTSLYTGCSSYTNEYISNLHEQPTYLCTTFTLCIGKRPLRHRFKSGLPIVLPPLHPTPRRVYNIIWWRKHISIYATLHIYEALSLEYKYLKFKYIKGTHTSCLE